MAKLSDDSGELNVESMLREDTARYESGFPNITGLAGFRVAPHVFNTLDEVNSVVERIRQLIA